MLRYVALASLVLAPKAVDAKCAMESAAPHVLTQPDTVIEDGGGVLVLAGGYTSDGDTANQAAWRFVTGGKSIKPVVTVLAPGLDLYAMPDSPDATVTLETDKHERVVEVRRSTTRAASRLPAPVVASVVTLADAGSVRFRTDSTSVHLPTGAPPGAVALIVYGVSAGHRTSAYSYGAVREGDRAILVYLVAHCTFPPPGARQAGPGEHVVVAWIDRSGRISEPSQPIEVVAGKAPR
jgi:hypothetical protein